MIKVNRKRKGGRPSKPTDEKRTHVVTIKLTDAEYSDLCKRAKAAGVKLAEFVRHGAFRLTIVSRLSEMEMNVAQGILRLSSDFNQALTWLNRLKLRSAAQKLLKVVDNMFFHSVLPNLSVFRNPIVFCQVCGDTVTVGIPQAINPIVSCP